MNPAQQQIVNQYNQLMQTIGGQIQNLLGQAGAGCQGMIQQNPTDPIPLNNAMTAVEQQFKELRGTLGDAFSAHYDKICSAGPGEPAHSMMKRALRAFDRWCDESWARFDCH